MIFLRSTLREFSAAGIAVFLVLLVIVFTTQLIRFLGFAAGGRIPADAVLILLGFSALGYLPVLLSGTLFGSVLLTVTRAYRDSEMVVWQSSGLGLLAWFRPVLMYATPIVLLVAVFSFYLTPWAIGKTEEYRHQLENRDDVSAVAPGVFKESKNGDRVFFVEKVSSDLSQVANIFVHSTQNGRQGRDGGQARLHGAGGQRRSLPRAGQRPPLRGDAGSGGLPHRALRTLLAAHPAERKRRRHSSRRRSRGPRACSSKIPRGSTCPS